MSEKQTRQEIIDKRLKKAGWDVDNPSKVISEHEVFHQVGTTSGVGYSDYVLLDEAGSPLAVVEAKKSSSDAQDKAENRQNNMQMVLKKQGMIVLLFFILMGMTFIFGMIQQIYQEKFMAFLQEMT